MRKRFDILPVLLTMAGVAAVVLAWWLLVQAIAGIGGAA